MRQHILDKRKVVLVGTGMVGMSYAYSLLNQSACDELVLIDINEKKAWGEAADLNHGLPFSGGNMLIRSGDYTDCKDADIVAITAGVAQKEGETRLHLLGRNAKIFESIIKNSVANDFRGIFLVATNPVDLMTQITLKLSGFPRERVFGTGTTLDTARLRYLLGEYFNVDSRNIHAYVMGEHGDSEFVPWSQATVGTRPVFNFIRESGNTTMADLEDISHKVSNAAYEIIAAKGSTFYGIGMAMTRITKAIFGNEHSILTLSTMLDGEYGLKGACLGVPCIVGRNGIDSIFKLDLTRDEQSALSQSCDVLCKTGEEVLSNIHQA